VETDDTLANTQLFAPRNDPRSHWYGKLSTTETWYMHVDQLGSILRVTDQDGRVRENFWYDPWGARTEKQNDRPGRGEAQRLADSWKRGFTGHEHLEAFSLIHMNGRAYSSVLSQFLSVDPLNQTIADTQGGNGYSYARSNPLRYIDPTGLWSIGKAWEDVKHTVGRAGTAVWHGATHAAGEVGKWAGQHWRELVVVAVVIVVSVLTVGAATPAAVAAGEAALTASQAILIGAAAGAAAGAAGGFAGAALYGGNIGEDIDAAVKGGVIGFFSGAAFAGVGSAFTPSAAQELTTTSQIEWTAAHGVVGGARSAAEGGNFWQGFIAAAATKATSFGGSFGNSAADTARAAVAGGTVALIAGDKFENGAITGAFSYAFNDLVHQTTTSSAAGLWHHRLVVTDANGKIVEGLSLVPNGLAGTFSFSSSGSAPSSWFEDDTSGYLNEDVAKRWGTWSYETFKTTPQEDRYIVSYMQSQIFVPQNYNLITNNCWNYCSDKFSMIKSVIEESRASGRSPVFH
jgi:RHS repeat-associated protein